MTDSDVHSSLLQQGIKMTLRSFLAQASGFNLSRPQTCLQMGWKIVSNTLAHYNTVSIMLVTMFLEQTLDFYFCRLLLALKH